MAEQYVQYLRRLLLLLRTVFHLVYLVSDIATVIYTVVVMVRKTSEPGASERLLDMRDNAPAFLTNWNMAFQGLFLVLAVWADGLEWGGRTRGRLGGWVIYLRDVIFCALVTPYAVFLSHSFWAIYWYDRELVFPRVFDEALPWWFNHCVHTNIIVMVALETLLQARPYPTSRKHEEALYWTVSIVYAAMMYILYLVTGHWLYQIFGVMTWWKTVLFQLYMWFTPYLAYRLQFPLNRLIHGSAEAQYYRQCLDYTQISKQEKQIREEDL
ncbi:androgen-dependent TFPI-regulating protein-like [Aricia agestis]|uniref:androgen-dependent TFPI-regulating protein-like n=1 Tax=Aricia agestis TaxID=91739 RepID=UPI001C2083A8|nr:androgen-dependent TFPI-regulating protein-like [Aricia agestis]